MLESGLPLMPSFLPPTHSKGQSPNNSAFYFLFFLKYCCCHWQRSNGWYSPEQQVLLFDDLLDATGSHPLSHSANICGASELRKTLCEVSRESDKPDMTFIFLYYLYLYILMDLVRTLNRFFPLV